MKDSADQKLNQNKGKLTDYTTPNMGTQGLSPDEILELFEEERIKREAEQKFGQEDYTRHLAKAIQTNTRVAVTAFGLLGVLFGFLAGWVVFSS